MIECSEHTISSSHIVNIKPNPENFVDYISIACKAEFRVEINGVEGDLLVEYGKFLWKFFPYIQILSIKIRAEEEGDFLSYVNLVYEDDFSVEEDGEWEE